MEHYLQAKNNQIVALSLKEWKFTFLSAKKLFTINKWIKNKYLINLNSLTFPTSD